MTIFITGIKRKTVLAFLLVFAVIQPGWAGTFSLDQLYTTINFRIKNLTGYTRGTFPKFDGKIVLSEDNHSLTKIEGVIDVAAVDTRLKERDDNLRSDKFFDAEKYPQVTFVTTQVGKDELTGNLTIRGITKPVKFKYEFWGLAKDEHGDIRTAVILKGSISRKDFGMDYNIKTDDGKDLLGDVVEFRIELHGILQ